MPGSYTLVQNPSSMLSPWLRYVSVTRYLFQAGDQISGYTMDAAKALAEAKAKGLVKEDIDECENVCISVICGSFWSKSQ
jgi:hypothetical protein